MYAGGNTLHINFAAAVTVDDFSVFLCGFKLGAEPAADGVFLQGEATALRQGEIQITGDGFQIDGFGTVAQDEIRLGGNAIKIQLVQGAAEIQIAGDGFHLQLFHLAVREGMGAAGGGGGKLLDGQVFCLDGGGGGINFQFLAYPVLGDTNVQILLQTGIGAEGDSNGTFTVLHIQRGAVLFQNHALIPAQQFLGDGNLVPLRGNKDDVAGGPLDFQPVNFLAAEFVFAYHRCVKAFSNHNAGHLILFQCDAGNQHANKNHSQKGEENHAKNGVPFHISSPPSGRCRNLPRLSRHR